MDKNASLYIVVASVSTRTPVHSVRECWTLSRVRLYPVRTVAGVTSAETVYLSVTVLSVREADYVSRIL